MQRLLISVWARALVLLLFCCWLSPQVAADIQLPKQSGWVVDAAHVIDGPTIRQLTDHLYDYQQRTSTQIVVVTVPALQDYPIEDWGLALLRDWHVGQAGKNNGIVLVVAPKDRKLRIETGYGIEGALPDAVANQIIRSVIVPRFADGKFAEGITAGVDAIEAVLAGSFTPDVVKPSVIGLLLRKVTWAGIRDSAFGLGLLLFLLYMIVAARRNGLRIYYGGRQWNFWQKAGADDPFRGVTIDLDQKSSGNDSSSNSSSSSRSSSSSSWGGGSSSSGSSSSSGFSGGGGSGGGGGASGSW